MLRPYKVGAETQIAVDAGPGGLGVVMTQLQDNKWVTVVYKSRSLKDAEKRYSQTEREALAIRWGVQKLRKYLLGAPTFKIITDHKPLQSMFNNGKQDLPPRIERFVMDIQGYDWEVVYKPGKNNIADYLSRHPVVRQGSSRSEEVEDHVKRVVMSSHAGVPIELDAITMEEVREATNKCPEMVKLKKAIRTGNFEDKELRRYKEADVRENLYVTDQVVYRGKRVVVPGELRDRAVKLSHKGHQGIVKTKQLLREFCWFPILTEW